MAQGKWTCERCGKRRSSRTTKHFVKVGENKYRTVRRWCIKPAKPEGGT